MHTPPFGVASSTVILTLPERVWTFLSSNSHCCTTPSSIGGRDGYLVTKSLASGGAGGFSLATYRPPASAGPTAITLRQGGRLIEDSRRRRIASR